MKKALVIIPTYNERETLPVIIDSVLRHNGFDVLVIDDGSPDGTAELVKGTIHINKRVFLIERPGKLGLGTAYVTGFKWGLERGYDYLIEMDADGSHNPDELPFFRDAMNDGCGLVIGSRYLNGTISVVGWDFRRLMLSKFGNYYASWILGMKLTDLTSGFRCYSNEALSSIDLDRIHSNGYSFQIEMAFRVSSAGFGVGEVPIIFRERESGQSKMSRKIIREAMFLPWRLRFGRLMNSSEGNAVYNIRTAVGFVLIITGLSAGVWLGVWLATEGDIIEIIHQAKMGLPGWAWMVMKLGLSFISAVLFIAFLFSAAVGIFAAGGKK
jgi:dolichol-phosphate mannosyltransferase